MVRAILFSRSTVFSFFSLTSSSRSHFLVIDPLHAMACFFLHFPSDLPVFGVHEPWHFRSFVHIQFARLFIFMAKDYMRTDCRSLATHIHKHSMIRMLREMTDFLICALTPHTHNEDHLLCGNIVSIPSRNEIYAQNVNQIRNPPTTKKWSGIFRNDICTMPSMTP